MAVKEGFEPSIRDKPYTPLAGERLQPLGHLTVFRGLILLSAKNKSITLLIKNDNHEPHAYLIVNEVIYTT